MAVFYFIREETEEKAVSRHRCSVFRHLMCTTYFAWSRPGETTASEAADDVAITRLISEIMMRSLCNIIKQGYAWDTQPLCTCWLDFGANDNDRAIQ